MTKKNNFGVCHGPWTHGTTRSPQEEEPTHIDLNGEELAAYAALADLVGVISKSLTSTDMI